MSLDLSKNSDPFALFDTWFSQAEKAGVIEPNAMTLATSNGQGDLLARVVLLKKHSPQGFCFFTNYQSQKGQQLTQNPKAALCFHWRQPEHRQIRIAGSVRRATPEESEAYFQSRHRGSRIAAWASPQSQKIDNREILDKKILETEERFKDQPVPCPPHWGGFWVEPLSIEFWQEQEFRRHDRFFYQRGDLKSLWEVSRLAP